MPVVAPSAIPDPRVRSKVRLVRSSGCWEWTAASEGRHGYFIRRRNGRQVKTYAHRYSWEVFHGPVPKRHGVRRTCKVRTCLNPTHLELYRLP